MAPLPVIDSRLSILPQGNTNPHTIGKRFTDKLRLPFPFLPLCQSCFESAVRAMAH
jgi:hypothetical protein